jgi:hypothetical protein
MTTSSDPADRIARRLARYRAALGPASGAAIGGSAPPDEAPPPRRAGESLAIRVAEELGATVERGPAGCLVRLDVAPTDIPLDRERLAALPGQPPPDVPLVCLDTETTGLATAAGTLAFLVGLGWWDGDRFRQCHLFLPDHADERAMLDAISARIPADAWLVTYNGRGFDWPLIETRFRMAGRAAPTHGGHLDLLPLVRRIFRHRLADARLKSVEGGVLGLARGADVAGWEIPAIYLDALRGGPIEALAAVVRHNEHDVRSLARLLQLVERRYASRDARRGAPRGDLTGLARAFGRDRRHDEALDCIDDALDAPAPVRDPFGRTPLPSHDPTTARAGRWDDDGWWARGSRPDFGGARPAGGWRGPSGSGRGGPLGPAASSAVWDTERFTDERLAAERARLLRRLGRDEEAAEAWRTAAAAPGALGIIAWIELAKLREHRLRDPAGALEATRSAWQACERARRLGRPLPRLEADLGRRGARLRQRVERARPVRTDERGPGSAASRRSPGAAGRGTTR